ncbi:MAG: hypothetical protein M3O89_07250, partial [Actinomycetota bacterium]|nr:hypothetical protein [Actinomycetota bacterium]
MSSTDETLEVVDRILNGGGDADDILREVVAALHEQTGYQWAGISFLEDGELALGPQAGTPDETRRTSLPVTWQGTPVAEIAVDSWDRPRLLEDVARTFAEHGANIVSYGGVVEDQMAKNWY